MERPLNLAISSQINMKAKPWASYFWLAFSGIDRKGEADLWRQ